MPPLFSPPTQQTTRIYVTSFFIGNCYRAAIGPQAKLILYILHIIALFAYKWPLLPVATTSCMCMWHKHTYINIHMYTYMISNDCSLPSDISIFHILSEQLATMMPVEIVAILSLISLNVPRNECRSQCWT